MVTKSKEIAKQFGTCDPFKIAEKLGFEIVYRTYSRKLKGYALFMNDKKYIIINDAIHSKNHALIVGHELAHYFLHKPHSLGECEFYNENTANHFAVSLLMQCKDIDKSLKFKMRLYCISDLVLYNIVNFFSLVLHHRFYKIFKL